MAAELRAYAESLGGVANDVLASTHPCFVSFGNSTPLAPYQHRYLLKSAVHLLIARMIFAELDMSRIRGVCWLDKFGNFLKEHAAAILSIDCLEDQGRRLKFISHQERS